ncbi:FlgD immunoglobulin-like domain containing protein [candidate division KSB1 bacterium]
MKRKVTFTSLMCIIALLLLVSVSFAQPTATITVKAYSPGFVGEDETDDVEVSSTGLPNVGVGDLVYLIANEDDTDITGYLWSITEAPTGSTAELSSTTTQNPTFRSDVVGQYKITVTVTDADGSDDTYIYINAGTYVGVGTDYISGDYAQCAACHDNAYFGFKVTEWKTTGHSVLFTDLINGLEGDHYAERCIYCHTTGYNADSLAVNGGFDDVATELEWEWPTPPAPGEWQKMIDDYPELANLGNIQCESCHGPGSEHKGQVDENQTAVSYKAELCAWCHERGSHHRKPTEFAGSAHSNIPGHMNSESCGGCHVAASAINMINGDDVDEVPEEMLTGITCVACHDPHQETDAGYQLRVGTEPSDMCYTCHGVLRTSSSTGFHHAHAGIMLDGESGYEYPGQVYMKGAHSDIEGKCVTCHMAEISAELEDLGEFDVVGGHSFKIVGVTSEGDTLLNQGGCESCHGTVEFEFLETSQAKISALLDTLKNYLPIQTSGRGAGGPYAPTDPSLNAAESAAAHNYWFVNRDGSLGIHNPIYAKQLLETSIADMRKSTDRGKLIGITDVPEDQGYQVRVRWYKFMNDAAPTNAVLNYSLWRLVDGSVSKSSNVIEVNSLKEMASKLDAAKGDALVKVAGSGYWDYVASVPASGADQYSYVAPTLVNSVGTDIEYSYFYISGHTADPTDYYVTDVDSGYSVDNMAPSTPKGLLAKIEESDVVLSWDVSVDTDIKYFAVYRSDTEGFDPAGVEPVGYATTNSFADATLSVDGTYYYAVSAVDFSDNQSDYSAKLTFVVTGVDPETGALLPDEFGIKQNFPNPFNPSTQIKYQLPEAASVTIKVYNILGKEIRTLVNAKESAGYKTVMWDGLDNNGVPVASGIYLYRIKAGQFNATKRMVFIK